MFRKTTILLFAIISLRVYIAEAAGDEIPVLLRVPRAEQHDTTGCNFVTLVSQFVYDLVNQNKIRLWDSRAKDIQITASTLAELEKSSRTRFTEPEVFFIYENWTKVKSGINTQTLGFMFLNKTAAGEDVSYGYVDYNDLKAAFIQYKIEANANLNNEMSLALFLYKKLFYYNIIQFGGKTVSTGAESNEIKASFIGGNEFNAPIKLPEMQERLITYIIDDKKTSDDPKTLNSISILKHIETYLGFNEEVFFNAGGEKVMNFIGQNRKIRVTRVQVQELWRKRNDEITTETRSIVIYVSDTALNPVSFGDFILWGIFYNDQSMYEVFREKNFTYFITQINAQVIPRKDSYLYYKALINYNWRKLTEYVKNY